ncbi:Na+/H+ antiporter NhaC family protein, partial [Desulfovibrio sp.]|uniref:Na+/H+ antiporter NhaC family protein n=1 Tax=Desulfovibrio sp. TaxID=885 RepID=UPI00307AE961
PRGLMSLKSFRDCAGEGMKAMMPANTILVLAWTISGVCRDLLQTPLFVKTMVADGGISGGLLPAIIFVVAGFLSFSTGTAWGTFGILIPIVVPVAQAVDPNLVLVCLSATLAGSVFGDHCSPISDTTILSSAGAGCAHLEHVSTQMLYACVVAASSTVGYVVSGLTHGSLLPGFASGLIFMVVTMLVLRQRNKQKDAAQA